ncbi:TPA: helix-turn-helix transcriptional regulator [Providencia rettgeri]
MNFDELLDKSRQLTSQMNGIYELSNSGFSNSDLTEMVGIALNMCSALHKDISNCTTNHAEHETKDVKHLWMESSLAERLKFAMVKQNITQSKLAAMAGVTQSVISSLVTGKTKESKKMYNIAVALGVELIWLYTGEGDMFSDIFLKQRSGV